nr:hypothetical protein [Candidatus Sigynarchaeota archaeon]
MSFSAEILPPTQNTKVQVHCEFNIVDPMIAPGSTGAVKKFWYISPEIGSSHTEIFTTSVLLHQEFEDGISIPVSFGAYTPSAVNGMLSSWITRVRELYKKEIFLNPAVPPHAIWFESFTVPTSMLGNDYTFSLCPSPRSVTPLIILKEVSSGTNGNLLISDLDTVIARCKDVLSLHSTLGPNGEVVFGSEGSHALRVDGTGENRRIYLHVEREIALPGWNKNLFKANVVLYERNFNEKSATYDLSPCIGPLPEKMDLYYGPKDGATLARILCLAHELAGNDANRLAIEIISLDTKSAAWRDLYPFCVRATEFKPLGTMELYSRKKTIAALRV